MLDPNWSTEKILAIHSYLTEEDDYESADLEENFDDIDFDDEDAAWNAQNITIADEKQLRKFSEVSNNGHEFTGQTITLKNDIDIVGVKKWVPIEYFDGTFDGNGKTIKGVIVKNKYNNQGLFASIDKNGTVKNLSVFVDIKGKDYVGGLAGDNSGKIENCNVSGSIIGRQYVGRLVGWNEGTIDGCNANINIAGKEDVGGVVGCNFNKGKIKNTCDSGSISVGVVL